MKYLIRAFADFEVDTEDEAFRGPTDLNEILDEARREFWQKPGPRGGGWLCTQVQIVELSE